MSFCNGEKEASSLFTNKEVRSIALSQIHIEALTAEMSVCKVKDYSQIDLNTMLMFTGKTNEENSLVCQTIAVPDNTIERDDGWRIMRIKGTLDFSLIGILSGISSELARNAIGIFAISTYNTDYILVKENNFVIAMEALARRGYIVENDAV